jgi:hypothetical protein
MRALVVGLFLAGCSGRQVVPPPSRDASPEPPADCAEACANLERLGCPEGRPASGANCVDVCDHAESTGVFSMRMACVASARSVGEVRACGTVRCSQ